MIEAGDPVARLLRFALRPDLLRTIRIGRVRLLKVDALPGLAGSVTDREKVRSALESTRISTGFGPVRFLDYRGFNNQNPVISIITQIQNGKPITVFPGRIAEGKIVVPK